MPALMTFPPRLALSLFKERIDSLEADTNRCFRKIEGGPGPAFFPPVFYAFATIDYFSSYRAGWNDRAGKRPRNQTDRLVEFMVRYLGYERRASKVAVTIWRHKLMHTAQPRVLRAKNGDRFTWETGTDLTDHVRLSPTGEPNEFILRFDSYAVIRDLRRGVLGPSGYFSDLCGSPDLQQKFLKCYNEMDNYSVDA